MGNKLQLAMGQSAGLNEVLVETGKMLYTTDDHKLYIDGPEDTAHVAINAAHADTATSASKADAWTTARTFTVGNDAQSIDGKGNVTWTLAGIGATVSNKWTGGTTAGPKISTTVNGVTGTAVAIPSASASASGIVTTGAQTFAGVKTFNSEIVGSVSGSAATWKTARTFTIGGTAADGGVSVDGSGNVTLKLPKAISGLTSVAATTFTGALTGNASTASKLKNAFTLSLTGSVTGSASVDGSGNVTLDTTTAHTHNYAGSASAGGPANSVKANLTICGHSYNGSTPVSIGLSELGLANAIHFIGSTTTSLTDGGKTSSITIGTTTYVTGTPASGQKQINLGDVVLYNNKEFIWTGTDTGWEELGDESSHALKTISITGTGALGGGGNLTNNRTITHNTTGAAGKSNSSQTKSITGSGATGSFTIPVITVDTYGHVKYTADSTISLTMPTVPTLYNLTLKTSASAATAATVSTTYDPDSAAKTFTIYTMKGATASAAGFGGLVPAPAKGTSYRALLADGTWGEAGIEWGTF